MSVEQLLQVLFPPLCQEERIFFRGRFTHSGPSGYSASNDAGSSTASRIRSSEIPIFRISHRTVAAVRFTPEDVLSCTSSVSIFRQRRLNREAMARSPSPAAVHSTRTGIGSSFASSPPQNSISYRSRQAKTVGPTARKSPALTRSVDARFNSSMTRGDGDGSCARCCGPAVKKL